MAKNRSEMPRVQLRIKRETLDRIVKIADDNNTTAPRIIENWAIERLKEEELF